MTHRRGMGTLLGAMVLGLLLVTGQRVRADEKPLHTAIKPEPRMKKGADGKLEPDPGWIKRHESFVAMAKKGHVDVLFLGDLITDAWGGESHNAKANGAKIFATEFEPLKAANFGIGGDRTQHVLWRLRNGELEGIHPKSRHVDDRHQQQRRQGQHR